MVNIALKAPTAPASTLENTILLASLSPRTATHGKLHVALDKYCKQLSDCFR